MTAHPHRQSWRRGSRRPSPHAPAPTGRGRWRGGCSAPTVFVVAGALFVTSMVSSGGHRPARRPVRRPRRPRQRGRPTTSRGCGPRSADLTAEVDRLTEDLGGGRRPGARSVARSARGPGRADPGARPGRHDHPRRRARRRARRGRRRRPAVSDLLVHQQDIQAVANALWAGGAEAMTIQGQRVVATTGHQVRRQHRDPARRAVLPAVPHLRDRPDRPRCSRR